MFLNYFADPSALLHPITSRCFQFWRSKPVPSILSFVYSGWWDTIRWRIAISSFKSRALGHNIT